MGDLDHSKSEIRKSKTSKLKLETVKQGEEWYVYDFAFGSGEITTKKFVDDLLDPVIEAANREVAQTEEKRGPKTGCSGALMRGDHPHEAPRTLILTGFTPSTLDWGKHDAVRKARAKNLRDRYLKDLKKAGRVQIVNLKLDHSDGSAGRAYFRFMKKKGNRTVIEEDTPERRSKSRSVLIRLGPTKLFTKVAQRKEAEQHLETHLRRARTDLKKHLTTEKLEEWPKYWVKLAICVLGKLIDSSSTDDRYYRSNDASAYVNYTMLSAKVKSEKRKPGQDGSRVQSMRDTLARRLRCAESRSDFMNDVYKEVREMYLGMVKPSQIAGVIQTNANNSLKALIWWTAYRADDSSSIINCYKKVGDPPVDKSLGDILDELHGKVTGWMKDSSDPDGWSSDPGKWPLK